MKILILNPPDENTVIENPDESGDGFLEGNDFGDFPPLGALYVLSYCEEKTEGHEFFFLDCVGEQISHIALRSKISEIQPDIIGITSFTISLIDVCKAAQTVREVVPNAHVCLGGHHPIAHPFEAAQLREFDSIVVGEGEVAFTELVRALERGEDIEKADIKGVYTCENLERFRSAPIRDSRFLAGVTIPPAYVDAIDSIPMVNRKYIRHIKYRNILGVTANLATILSSRGCPYQCTFCDVPIKSYRERDHDLVLDEVEACIAMGYTEFRFYDDMFNINEKKILQFCEAIERRGMNFTWDFRGRVNGVTYESLRKAKSVGLRMISFGVETGSDEGLQKLKKETMSKKIHQAFQWSRELGILTVADFIIGLPTERTPADVKRNIDFLIGLDPDYGQISILTLYPNTEIYRQAVEKGLVEPDRWQKWSMNPTPNFIVDHWEEFMPYATIAKLQKQSYRRFYFRPKYILRSLFKTGSFYEFASKVQGAMKLLRTNQRTA